MSFNDGTPPDPIESFARGATKGFLDWTSERVDDLICRFKNKELAFVEDDEVIK